MRPVSAATPGRIHGLVMQSHNASKGQEGASLAKRLDRRTALRLMVWLSGIAASAATGAAAAWSRAGHGTGPAPLGSAVPADSRYRPLATGTIPQSFAMEEFRALEQLVERIIPTTDTPGARGAGVHWYLDQVSQVEPETRQRLKDGLRRVEERARASFGKSFVELSEEQQGRVLTLISGSDGLVAVEVTEAGKSEVREVAAGAAPGKEEVAFFNFLKGRVIDAYYKSEIGQLGELRWVGHEFNDTFRGACTHPGPLVHPRPGWRPPAPARRGG